MDNYKTILKSANIIKDMKEDAKERKVLLDEDVTDKADGEVERLVAERNLR